MLKKLFSPAITLLNRLNYTKKFTLLWVLSLVAVAVVVYSLFVSMDRIIQPSQRQLEGLALIEPFSRAVQSIQLHRGISAALLGGNEAMRDRRAAQENKAAGIFDALEEKLPAGMALGENFRTIRKNWERLRKEGLNWEMEANFAAHTHLIKQIRLFEAFVADEYLLTPDPQLASYYLIDTILNRLPHTLEQIGQLRGYGTGILAKKQLSEQHKIKLHTLIVELDSVLREVTFSIDKTSRYNPSIQKSLMATSDDLTDLTRQITGIVASDIFAGHFATSPDVFLDMITAKMDKSYAQIYDAMLPAAEALIRERIATAQNTLYLSTGIAFLALMLVVYLSASLYYAIVGNIQSLVGSARAFAGGDLNTRIKLDTRDELSWVGDSFNQMADGFNAMLEAQRADEARLHSAASELMKANAQIEEERAHLAERVMERTTQLQYANLAKDSFLATMSHEIRTPLGGLLGMMELLGLSPLDNEQRNMLRAARDSGKSLLRIVNDILDWSKIEAGKLKLAPQAAMITEILKGVVSTYSSLASEKSLMLRLQIDGRLGTAHIFDPLRLAQILNNFTSNAIKFTEQGVIEISAELIARHEGSEEVRFCVTDSGIGMTQEQQARLFLHYEQASIDTAHMYGGTGLGLVICRSLAELMGGNISVESAPGSGSAFRFTVSLPVASPERQLDLLLWQAIEEHHDDAPIIRPLLEDGKLWSALLVDDHPVNRMLLRQQLVQLGLHTEDAATGIAALSLWRTGRFDLIIADCHMPEMDGYELARSIREMEQQDGRRRVPIIAWTANVLAQEEEHCRAAGMDDILTKPTDLAELRAMLLKWLGGHSPATLLQREEHHHPMPKESRANKTGLTMDAPLDFSVLKKIAKSYAAQVDILQEFNLHNRSDIANLKAALQEGNPAAVARIAHRIKGASRMVGALYLEGICTVIEKVAIQGDMNGARRTADTLLDAAVERLEAAIGKFIGGQ